MFNSEEQKKYFVDALCRYCLLELVEKSSKYRNNQQLKEYISNKATYNQVVLATVYGIPFTKSIVEDASQDVKIASAQEKIAPMLDLLAFFASMPLEEPTQRTVASALKRWGSLQKDVVPFKKGEKAALSKRGVKLPKGTTSAYRGFKFVPKKGMKFGGRVMGKVGRVLASGFGSQMIAFLGVTLGISLVSKLISSFLKSIVSKCRSECKKHYSKLDVENKDLRIKLCITSCKVKDYNQTIAKLRTQISNCNKTENPEKCQEALIKQVARLNDLLIQEKQKLKNLQDKFRKKTV